MAKILSTRVKNRFDTLANWSTTGVELLPGESALVSVTEQKIDATTGNVVNVPAILMKVGAYKKDANGNPTSELETFANLPWLSAKAADVYSWAKSEKAEDVTIEVITDTNKTETKKLSAWLESLYNTAKTATAAIAAKADASSVYTTTQTDNKISGELDKLTHTTSGSGGFVTGVTQSKGKITVTKADLPSGTATTAGIVKLGAEGGAATYETVAGLVAAVASKAEASNVYTKNEADGKITQALAALSYTNSATGFVTNVKQTNGKIEVSKSGLPAASSTSAGIAKLGATGGAATYETVETLSGKVGDLESAVAGGVHFIGEVTVPADLSSNLKTQTVTIVKTGNAPASHTAADGDVVIQGEKEYIWAAGAWKELGDLSRVGKLETLTGGLISSARTEKQFVTHIIKDSNNKLVAKTAQPQASDVYYDTASGEKTVAVELANQDARLDALEAVNVPNLITTEINKLDHTTSGTGSFVTNVTQANGVVAVTKGNLPTASSTTAGIVKLGADGGAATHGALTTVSGKVGALETDTLQFDSSSMKLYGGTGRTADDEIIFDCGGAI